MKELQFDDSIRQGEDWDVFIRIAEKKPIVYVKEPLLIYSDGSHERVTNEVREYSVFDLEKRAGMIEKHRDFFGPFWYRFHVADTYLSYIGSRKDKLSILRYVVKRCGILAVFSVLLRKSLSRAAKLFHLQTSNRHRSRMTSHRALP